jgi:hypothetical protein
LDNVDGLLPGQPQLVGRARKRGGIPDRQRRRFADSGFSTQLAILRSAAIRAARGKSYGACFCG